MKKIILLFSLFLMVAAPLSATPYFSSFKNTDGTALTNAYQMQAWPPVNTWIVYGTNVVYGGQIVTNTPNSSGYISNSTYPNTFRIYFPDLDSGFYVVIPDTTNFLSLSVYTTNTAVTSGTYLGGYGLVTNWLNFPPATNTFNGITNALHYFPATNNPATNIVIYISGITTFTNASGAVTNITYTLGTNTLKYQQY